jgi:hypothetical protein
MIVFPFIVALYNFIIAIRYKAVFDVESPSRGKPSTEFYSLHPYPPIGRINFNCILRK